MSNSPLVTYTNITRHRNSPRNHKIDTITIHCMAGQMSGKGCADYFATTDRDVSSNYCIGYDGDIALSVPEADRSWCSSSASNDHRAITIEVSSESKSPYAVTDKAYAALLDLVTDICKRNDIKALNYTGDTSGNMTKHCWFANKACPGQYLSDRFPAIQDEVNRRLNGDPEEDNLLYLVQVGAFKKKAYAEDMVKNLKTMGIDAVITIKGDVDDDGKITAADARQVLRWSVGKD